MKPAPAMKSSWRGRYRSWAPAAAVAAVVVLAGARMIVLSAHEHAAQRRSAAQDAVARITSSMDVQLQGLIARAQAQARLAAGSGGRSARPLAADPGSHAFWMADAGGVLRSGDPDPAISRSLAAEWLAARAAGRAAGALFGPIRYGSRWFAAAQEPVVASTGKPVTAGARAVAYVPLDELLLRAGVAKLAEQYDFELYQGGPGFAQPRMLLPYRSRALADPVTGAVVPAAASGPAAAYLQLAIRPRAGWYPAGTIATEIALLILIAWVAAFAAEDLVHDLDRTRDALALSRRRLRAVNARLATEIEQHQALQKSLEHARYHDPSTGLPNRRYFMNQLDRALRDLHARRRERLGVVLIELDRFAFINDTLGHTAGEELLLQAAQRFAGALEGREYTLARWGGDQCVVLLYQLESAAEMRAVTAALQSARQEPFALRKHRVRAAVRMGCTCVEGGPRTPEEVLREADVALSLARRPQGALAVEYRPEMGGAAVTLVSLEADLQLALDRGEFSLLFQPIIDLHGGRAVGLEALLRWRHPVEGLLAPERFLATAEEAGVIVPVTRWVIQRVCRLVAAWRGSLPANADFYVSVNVSAAVLRDAELPAFVAQVLAATHVPPGYLKFEFAERGLVENVSTARPALAALHAMGIELMLDDFGTGYSPLSYLQLVPFGYVKIDRPFVNRTGSERANSAITAAMLQVATSLGLHSIAEVVETEGAARALAQLGCEFAQGYYFSEPVDAPEALEQLRRSPAPSTIRSRAPIRAQAPPDAALATDGDTLVLAGPDADAAESAGSPRARRPCA
ncbi:MAG TPA: bifunctional diguanylate cyclase/phosphodiesterase [Steroidobacteraceae bacterium]|nr:bifunctional diguanylate cyclase/phosphodiesterase [Steroidobacteraceae bacterium]